MLVDLCINVTNANHVYVALSYFFSLIILKSDTDVFLWFKAKQEILTCHSSKGDKKMLIIMHYNA